LSFVVYPPFAVLHGQFTKSLPRVTISNQLKPGQLQPISARLVSSGHQDPEQSRSKAK
jgi:hypothetical protein